MHLQTAQPQMLHLAGARIDALDLFVSDAELVFVGARRDLGVRAGVHVGIDPHGHGSDFLQAGGHAVDPFELGFTLDIERVNPSPQRKFDFPLGLAYPGENTFPRITARRDHPAQFPFAHHIKPAPQPRQGAHDGRVGVGLHRETDHVIQRGERLVQLLKMIGQCLLGINVKGRAELADERFNGHAFAVEPASDVKKIVHTDTS